MNAESGGFRLNSAFSIPHSAFPPHCVLPNAECRHTKAQKSHRDTSIPHGGQSTCAGNLRKLPLGLEPRTSTLPRWRSTTELWQRDKLLRPQSKPRRAATHEGSARLAGSVEGGRVYVAPPRCQFTARANLAARGHPLMHRHGTIIALAASRPQT